MRSQIAVALLFLVSAAAGAAACRHLGMSDEPDSGPGPHCDPCAEYQIRVNACLRPACEGMECDVCFYEVSRLKDPACGQGADGGSFPDGTLEINPDSDIDAGPTCSGSDREEAYEKLRLFTCEDDEYVSGLLETIERECVPAAPKVCETVGEPCDKGYFCYYSGGDGGPRCMTPGDAWVGESCSASNGCIGGAQCLQAGDGPMVCWHICWSYSDCDEMSECTDTGLGFSVCVAYEE
jgi:hypothetical protein